MGNKLKHNIRSIAQMKKEKKKMSSLVFDMEYNNIMAGGAENQFYSFELVSQAQKIKKGLVSYAIRRLC